MNTSLLQFEEDGYYAVIFTSLKSHQGQTDNAYSTANDTLEAEAAIIDGFLGMEP